MQACVASILELPLSAVPFIDPDAESVDSFMSKWREFARSHGYDLVFMTAGEKDLPRGFSVGVGEAANEEDHAVVCLNGEIVHDPFVGAKPLQSIKAHGYFVAMYPKGQPQ